MICIALQFKLCANKMIQDFNSAICQISLKFCSAATRSQASSAVRPAYVASLPRLVRYMNRSLRHQTHRLSRRVERKTSAHCTHSLAGYMVVPHGQESRRCCCCWLSMIDQHLSRSHVSAIDLHRIIDTISLYTHRTDLTTSLPHRRLPWTTTRPRWNGELCPTDWIG